VEVAVREDDAERSGKPMKRSKRKKSGERRIVEVDRIEAGPRRLGHQLEALEVKRPSMVFLENACVVGKDKLDISS
jgi:hypothetical protein